MKKLLPVLLGFFVMGMVDVVGIATNYAKHDFSLRDSVANLLPLMVFVWFALLSIPTGLLMNRLGRRVTVVIGMGITLVGLVVPVFVYHYTVLLGAFALIGIGNTLLQVALNPLLADVTSARRLASALTLGQLIKALASLSGPAIAAGAVVLMGNWRGMLPVFAVITIVVGVWLGMTRIQESTERRPGATVGGRPGATIGDCLRLLKDRRILSLFLGIVAIVGIDVGLNTTIPKFLMQRCHLPLAQAGLGTSLYFIARTVGSFAGVFVLARWRSARVLLWSALLIVGALVLLPGQGEVWRILALVSGLGLGVSNVFPIVYSAALRWAPGQANEISGLMIMGVSGGAVLLPVMGVMADRFGVIGALGVVWVAAVYLAGLAQLGTAVQGSVATDAS